MKTFDIYFHNDENSNNKGFKFSLEEAKDYIEYGKRNGDSYFSDYRGGIAQIVCNETDEVVETFDI